MPLETVALVSPPLTDQGALMARVAQLDARLAGMSREVSAVREEMARLTAQHAADHALTTQFAELLRVLKTDEATWRHVQGVLHQPGNRCDPLLQLLRTLTDRPLVKL